MRNIVLISLLLVACGDNKSKLDAAPKADQCGKANRAARFLEAEAKAESNKLTVECEEYYCNEGQTEYSAARCELSNGRRVWVSTDILNGPVFKWLGEPPPAADGSGSAAAPQANGSAAPSPQAAAPKAQKK